jgi:hypothetical protein
MYSTLSCAGRVNNALSTIQFIYYSIRKEDEYTQQIQKDYMGCDHGIYPFCTNKLPWERGIPVNNSWTLASQISRFEPV